MDRVDGFAMYDAKMGALDGRTDGHRDVWQTYGRTDAEEQTGGEND